MLEQEVLRWVHSDRSGAKTFPVGLCLAHSTSVWVLYIAFSALRVASFCSFQGVTLPTHSLSLSHRLVSLNDGEPTLVQWPSRPGTSASIASVMTTTLSVIGLNGLSPQSGNALLAETWTMVSSTSESCLHLVI